jgi:hypothetical protein
MSIFSRKLGFALVLAALTLGAPAAHAQSAPVSYWLPNWPLGFGGSLSAASGANSYGNFPSFDGTDARGNAFSTTRFNFSNGWFVGSERANLGLSSFSQDPTFGSFHTEGVQFGYNFKNSSLPVTIYGGLDTVKYNTGIGNPFAPFESQSGTAGYSAHAGVEIQPTSNLSLSLGVGYSQQSGDVNSLVLPGASPFVNRR